MPLKIISISSQFPKKFETLENLKNSKKNIKKLFSTTGINKRYTSENNENVISLSIKSANKLLKKNNKKDIGFLIFVSQTSPFKFPSVSCILQNKLGLDKNIFAIDVNMGCSGYIYALKVASSLENLEGKKNGLIICSDTYTKFISKNNTSCKPIFSDASTTTLLGFSKKKHFEAFGFGVDGNGYQDLYLKENSKEMFMNGAKIALFTLKEIPIFLINFFRKNNINKSKIKFLVMHQASKYIFEKLKNKLNLKNSIFLKNYQKVGNTISSSIPLLLKEIIDKKKIKKGDNLVACGFGVGLSWGAVKIKW